MTPSKGLRRTRVNKVIKSKSLKQKGLKKKTSS
jgi:hypothetical protein